MGTGRSALRGAPDWCDEHGLIDPKGNQRVQRTC
jgi:hypothetical protein